jgi:hypothetical protein
MRKKLGRDRNPLQRDDFQGRPAVLKEQLTASPRVAALTLAISAMTASGT